MKRVFTLILIISLPVFGFSQTLTGLWSGSLSNDSSTIRRDQTFEMALTEYKGKIYGYSHTTFMVHDSLFYIVKRVKGKVNGNICEVVDDEMISCNFLAKKDKGVKQVYTFRLNETDSVWRLDGEWKTLKTKNYYSLSGSVETATEKDLTKSKLFPHLQELNLTKEVAAALPPAKIKTAPERVAAETMQPDVATRTPVKLSDLGRIEKETATTGAKIPVTEAPKARESKKEEATKIDPVTTTPTDVATNKPAVEKKAGDIVVKTETAIATPDAAAPKTVLKNELPVRPIAALNVAKRKLETQQIVDFKSDSLSISLFDNGEIDGDTVSVLINGDIIMANQGLKASAIKKTIYITPAMTDSFTLVLYAENLGKYPPNTGLMIVHDGDEVYQVRFSADLQKNVAVIFKRKKK